MSSKTKLNCKTGLVVLEINKTVRDGKVGLVAETHNVFSCCSSPHTSQYGVPMAVVVYVAILLYRKARPRHEVYIVHTLHPCMLVCPYGIKCVTMHVCS